MRLTNLGKCLITGNFGTRIHFSHFGVEQDLSGFRSGRTTMPIGGRALLRLLLIPVSLVLAIAFCAQPQDSKLADLSGAWKLNLGKSKLAEHSPIVSSTLAITCSSRTIRIDAVTNGEKQNPWIYTTDGKEHFFAEDEVAKAKWDKSVLVTRLISRKIKPRFDFTDRWSVSADGRTLTQESKDHTLVYDKQ
jgi:hypothetical protein